MQKLLISALLLTLTLQGCVTVKPWQKRNLAKRQMVFDSDPIGSRFSQHVFESKEGASGGYGLGGGGCGCN